MSRTPMPLWRQKGYAYISIESIDRILLSSFELKAILVVSSLRTLCLSVLNLKFSLLFCMNSFLSSLRVSASFLFLKLLFFLSI